MTKHVLFLMFLLAGCGSPQPPSAKPPAKPVAAIPAAEAPPPAETGIYARLRQAPGPVPGLSGYTLTFVPDKQYCGGFRIETKHGASSPNSEEVPLAEVFAIEFPHDLDFVKDPRGAKAAFDRWDTNMQAVSSRAVQHYGETRDQARAHGDEVAVLEAHARRWQVMFRIAAVLARAWIPADISTGDYAAEKIQAYCDLMRPQAEAIVDSAERGANVCADRAAELGKHGWWDPVCKHADVQEPPLAPRGADLRGQ
jgi:hypothetical protein